MHLSERVRPERRRMRRKTLMATVADGWRRRRRVTGPAADAREGWRCRRGQRLATGPAPTGGWRRLVLTAGPAAGNWPATGGGGRLRGSIAI